jgi:hypothetical protein
MFHRIENNVIVESVRVLPKDFRHNGVLYPLRQMWNNGAKDEVAALGWLPERRIVFPLAEGRKYGGMAYNILPDVVEAWQESVPKTAEDLAVEREAAIRGIIKERERRLALGFDYDFGDARGIHRIGTTEQDHKGWDKVAKLASAAIFAGLPNTVIDIETDTGPVQVTAAEWQQLTLAVALWEQPIWHASFVLQAMDPIPENFTDDIWWQTP